MATSFPDLTIERIKSERNKDKATTHGYIYTLNRVANGIEYWVCEKRGSCKARIHTSNNDIIKPHNSSEIYCQHSHSPDMSRVEMLRGYNNLKEVAKNSETSTRNLLANSVQNMSAESIVKLPKLASVKRTIRNCKSTAEEYFGNPSCCAEVIIPNTLKFSHKGDNFLLFDSGEGDVHRLILFGTPNFLSILKESPNWFCDGTFKVVPEHFFQIYTIHAEKDGYIFPCVYGLLEAKNERTYDQMNLKLLELEPELNPKSIMMDFEKAAMNFFENHFNASVSGCFFHLAQSVYRKIQAEGLTTRYQQDKEFALKLKMLPCLAFVPENDVIDSFNMIMEEYPQSAMGVAKYFENTYIGKKLPNNSRRTPPFPIRVWNMYMRIINRQARTNNSVEGWHNAFGSGISHSHPSLPKLLKHLKREQSLQEAVYSKWEGGEHKEISKLSLKREERILTLVAAYSNRNLLDYLRGVAYNINI